MIRHVLLALLVTAILPQAAQAGKMAPRSAAACAAQCKGSLETCELSEAVDTCSVKHATCMDTCNQHREAGLFCSDDCQRSFRVCRSDGYSMQSVCEEDRLACQSFCFSVVSEIARSK